MSHTLTRLQAPLQRLAAHVPAPLLSLHFAAGLELARRLRWLSPPPELDGRSFAINLRDLGLRHAFCCRQGQFRPHWPQAVDLELSASTADFLAMLRGQMDADTLFFQRRLQISGDTELGLIVKNWLDAAERPAWLDKLASCLPG